MSTGSGIQWTGATWNPVTGCTRASAGCDNCYAVTMTHRLESMGQEKYAGLTVLNNRGDRHFNGVVRTHDDALEIPLRWRKPRRVFVNSMSDLFHKDVPFEFIDRVFAVMALCPQHTFQILTKRPERMAEYLAREDSSGYKTPHRVEYYMVGLPGCPDQFSIEWPLPNVWLGTSVEGQPSADARIPHLLRCPAEVRFVSYEPALGPVDFMNAIGCGTRHEFDQAEASKLHWLIVGGESGKGARPFDIAWARSAIEQCKAAGLACFVKQLGSRPRDINHGEPMPMPFDYDDGGEQVERWYRPSDPKGGDMAEWPEDLRVRQFPTTNAGNSPASSAANAAL